MDNKAPSDMRKTPLSMFDIVETSNIGVGKGKSVVVERGKGDILCLPKTITLMQGLSMLSAIDVERFTIIPMNVLNGRQ